METIQLSIDESLLAETEQVAQSLEMSRSDFINAAVERALQQRDLIALERRDIQGYVDQPQDPDEIAEWQKVQDWGEP